MKTWISTALVVLIAACSTSIDLAGEEQAIRQVMAEQENAWNTGDLEAFMQGYWKSDSLIFIGSSTQYGWQKTLDNYKRSYPNKDSMGELGFEIMEVKVLSQTHAHVIGKWKLTRDKMVDLSGHYTLLWEKIGGKWVIVADHSS